MCRAYATISAACLAAILSAPAWAAFDRPFELSPANSRAPQVAFDGSGNALFAWWRAEVGSHNRVEIRTRSAAGELGNAEMISRIGQNAIGPRMAMNAAGQSVIAWQALVEEPNFAQILRIQVRTRSASGELGPIRTVSAAGRNAGNPRVAMNANGDVMIVWERHDGTNQRIQARGLSATGVLGKVLTLSRAGSDAFNPKVVIDNNGNAYAVWQRAGEIQGRAHVIGGITGLVQNFSNGTLNGGPMIATDGAGNSLIFWTGSDGTHQQVQGRSRDPSGALGPIETSPGGTHTAAPSVAMRPNGKALIAWLRMEGGPHFLAQTIARSAAGVYGAPQTLSETGQHAFAPQIGMNTDGEAVIAWRRSDGEDDRIQARFRSAGGVLRKLQTISRRGRNADQPQVVLGADGTALAVWNQADGEGTLTNGAGVGP
jgi:hypothetical protein